MRKFLFSTASLVKMMVFIALINLTGCSVPAGLNDDPAKQDKNLLGVSARALNLPCDGTSRGYDYPYVDPSRLTGFFRVELTFSVAETQLWPYANILDINHRTNVGLVIQQDGTNNNTFLFGIGDGAGSCVTTYHFDPGYVYSVVFERNYAGVKLLVDRADSLGAADISRAKEVFDNDYFNSIAFLPGSYPTVGYNRNYGRYFNGTVYRVQIYESEGSTYQVTRGGATGHGDIRTLPSGAMTQDFVVELAVQLAPTQAFSYATILDINHRTNVGIVIQEDPAGQNIFDFGIGFGGSDAVIAYQLPASFTQWTRLEFRRDGSVLSLAVDDQTQRRMDTGNAGPIAFLPNSLITVGYNVNYYRYLTGQVGYISLWSGLLN